MKMKKLKRQAEKYEAKRNKLYLAHTGKIGKADFVDQLKNELELARLRAKLEMKGDSHV